MTNAQKGAPAPDPHGLTADVEGFMREPECRRLTGLSRMTRWRLEREGRFPKKRQLSPGCKGWPRSEVRAWMAERPSSPAPSEPPPRRGRTHRSDAAEAAPAA